MNISIDEFAKVEIRVGRFVEVTPVEGSEKLLKEIVDFGPEIGTRQILSGIRKWYSPEDLVGKQGIFIINLEPRKMMGLESQGMLVAVDPGDGSAVLLQPDKDVEPGAKVR